MPTAAEYGIIEVCIRRRRPSPATAKTTTEECYEMDEVTKKYLTAAALLVAAAGASEIAATNSGIDLGDVEAACHTAAQAILDSVDSGPPALGVQTPTPPPPPPPPPQRQPARQPRR
jgi:hypothetical protein